MRAGPVPQLEEALTISLPVASRCVTMLCYRLVQPRWLQHEVAVCFRPACGPLNPHPRTLAPPARRCASSSGCASSTGSTWRRSRSWRCSTAGRWSSGRASGGWHACVPCCMMGRTSVRHISGFGCLAKLLGGGAAGAPQGAGCLTSGHGGGQRVGTAIPDGSSSLVQAAGVRSGSTGPAVRSVG